MRNNRKITSHVALDDDMESDPSIKVSLLVAKTIFHTAYEDRFLTPDHWRSDPFRYLVMIEGCLAIAAKDAAKRGENPWEAVIREYVSKEIPCHPFTSMK